MSDNNEPKSEVLDFDELKSDQTRPRALQTTVGIPQPHAMTVSMTSQELVTFAVLNDKLDMLDRVIALKNAEEDRAARIEFDKRFAEMQQEFKAVEKTKKGQFGPYADINDILAVYGPVLSRHGFSWSFPEEEIPGQLGWKKVFCVIKGHGHSERTPFVCPPAPENKGSSAIQKEAGNTTYGKRQAFNSAVGVFLKDEDKDGDFTFDMGVDYAEEIKLMREATTIPELYANYKTVTQNKDDAAKKMFFDLRFKLENEIRKAGS